MKNQTFHFPKKKSSWLELIDIWSIYLWMWDGKSFPRLLIIFPMKITTQMLHEYECVYQWSCTLNKSTKCGKLWSIWLYTLNMSRLEHKEVQLFPRWGTSFVWQEPRSLGHIGRLTLRFDGATRDLMLPAAIVVVSWSHSSYCSPSPHKLQISANVKCRASVLCPFA